MDPNGNVIPIVEGDQGEGFKDPWEKKGDRGIKEPSFEEMIEEQMKGTVDEKGKILDEQMLGTARDNLKESLKKEFTGKGIEGEEVETKPFPKMRMKKGMRIHFYGYSYKVTAVRPNGKITLRFDGLWKDKPQS